MERTSTLTGHRDWLYLVVLTGADWRPVLSVWLLRSCLVDVTHHVLSCWCGITSCLIGVTHHILSSLVLSSLVLSCLVLSCLVLSVWLATSYLVNVTHHVLYCHCDSPRLVLSVWLIPSCLILSVSTFTVGKRSVVPVLDSSPLHEGIWRGGGRTPVILNSGVRRWWVIGFTLRPVLPLGEELTLTHRIGSWCEGFGKVLPLPKTEARFLSLGFSPVTVLTVL